jgi:hypothetical protein
VQVTILKTAYQCAPERFRNLLDRFFDSQNQQRQNVTILDRAVPVWDGEIAELLRGKLVGGRLSTRAYGSVLAVLIQAGDPEAKRIATNLVAGASDTPAEMIARPVQAALELLDHDPTSAWQVVWPVAKSNYAIAENLVGSLAFDPYSSTTTRVLKGLHPDALAAFQIWLFRHHPKQEGGTASGVETERVGPFTAIRSNDRWYRLGVALINNLIQRGTPAAAEAIRKIKEAFPNENLDRVKKVAEEFAREKTWIPPSPSDLLALILDGARERERATTLAPAKKRGRPAKIALGKKQSALAARKNGRTWREVAKILYGTHYPTAQQVKNAPNVLKHYERSLVQPPNKP